MIVATTLISLLIGGYAVIATNNSQLALIDRNLDEIVLSTKGPTSDAIASALLAVHQNNLNAIVDFVDGSSISQLSLATFSISSLPAKSQLAASRHTIETSPLGGGIRYRTVELAGGDYLLIAVSSADAQHATHQLILRLLLFIVIADVLLSGAVQVVIRRDTKKIEQLIGLANDIANNIEDVNLPESSGRSDMDQLSSALGRMVETLNGAVLLERSISQRMQEFLGDASHELRTPLTVIRGYSELLRSEQPPSLEVQQRALARMNDEVRRMELLISDLLLLTELGEQQVRASESVDVSAIVSTHVGDLRALDPGRDVRGDVDEGVRVVGSSANVERLVQNLFSNVRRHTPADAPVHVALHEREGSIEFCVEDGGPGLPESAYERNPQSFTRFDRSRSRESGGSGLGMSIIVAIVTDLDGSIELRPSDLGGLCVNVTLPLAKAHAALTPDEPTA
jgi:signal transduction histidine kinase